MPNNPVFSQYIMAGYPLLYVETHEEYRAIGCLLKEFTNTREKYHFYTFDCVDGIASVKLTDGKVVSAKIQSDVPLSELKEAFEWIEKANPNSILILKDTHHYIEKPTVTRKIRNLTPIFKAAGKALICMSPVVKIPPEIEKEITVIPFKLPTKEDLKIILRTVCEAGEVKYPESDELLLDSALGMTSFEAENSFAVSLIETRGKFDPKIIQKEKAAIVRKTGLLEIVEQTYTMADIGGNDNLKAWITGKGKCFTEGARRFGILPPKGALFVGPPGTGKSLSAKAISAALNRPLLRLDLGRVYGQYVGESESNLRKVFTQVEGVAPCVLMIDELEKALGGAEDGHEVRKSIFGNLLTWMNDKTADIFIVATANDCKSIPPAMLRSGRFDKIFYVDFPDKKSRKEIFNIHIKKIGRKPANLINDELLAATEGFTGAEIEVLLQESLTTAFTEGSELQTNHILASIGSITPTRKMMGGKVQEGLEWAKEHGALFASTPEEAAPVTEAKRKISKS